MLNSPLVIDISPQVTIRDYVKMMVIAFHGHNMNANLFLRNASDFVRSFFVQSQEILIRPWSRSSAGVFESHVSPFQSAVKLKFVTSCPLNGGQRLGNNTNTFLLFAKTVYRVKSTYEEKWKITLVVCVVLRNPIQRMFVYFVAKVGISCCPLNKVWTSAGPGIEFREMHLKPDAIVKCYIWWSSSYSISRHDLLECNIYIYFLQTHSHWHGVSKFKCNDRMQSPNLFAM